MEIKSNNSDTEIISASPRNNINIQCDLCNKEHYFDNANVDDYECLFDRTSQDDMDIEEDFEILISIISTIENKTYKQVAQDAAKRIRRTLANYMSEVIYVNKKDK